MSKKPRYTCRTTSKDLIKLKLYREKFIIIDLSAQMTLWSMAKSPLMFGGDLRSLDNITFNMITNPTLLEINSFSSNNKEVSCKAFLSLIIVNILCSWN